MAESDLVDIVNEADEKTGTIVRGDAHRDGVLHRAVHVWFVTPDRKIIFQRRGAHKETYPNLLDATVGGHVDAGDDWLETALRETAEETGVTVTEQDLQFVDQFTVEVNQPDKNLHVHELQREYAYVYTGPIDKLKIEAGKAAGFEAWGIDELLSLTTEQSAAFIFELIGEPFPNMFARIALRAFHVPKPYSIHDTERGVYFFYDVDLSILPSEIKFNNTTFVRSQLPHCSLVTLDAIIPQLMERDSLSRGQAILQGVQAVVAAIDEFNPRITGYRPEFRFADKPEKGNQSIVVMANLEHNTEFQQRIGEALRVMIPPRPAHVTLYTLENGNPIPLGTPEQLTQYSRLCTDDELATLKTLIPIDTLLESKP